MAVEPQVGVGGCGPVGQHHVEPVQGQVGQQVVKLVFVAEQAQVGVLHGRGQQVAHRQLGQAVGNAHHQPHTGLAARFAHGGVQVFAEMKNLLRHFQRGLARVGERQAPACGFEQRVAQRLF